MSRRSKVLIKVLFSFYHGLRSKHFNKMCHLISLFGNKMNFSLHASQLNFLLIIVLLELINGTSDEVLCSDSTRAVLGIKAASRKCLKESQGWLSTSKYLTSKTHVYWLFLESQRNARRWHLWLVTTEICFAGKL